MKFGGKPTMKDKMAMTTKRGYDSGTPSRGAAPTTKWKVKPTGTIKRPGIKATKKF